MSPRIFLFSTCLSFFTPVASAQYLLVVETTNDRVWLLSEFDGSVVDSNYIDLLTGGSATPIEACIVGSEIWVSDQIVDGLMRFSLDGNTYLGTHTGGLNNVRGFAFANNELFVTHASTGTAAPANSVVRFSLGFANLGFAASPDPFDVCPWNGELLVADGATDDLRRYDYALNYLGNFHSSDGVTGIDWVEQIVVRANGNVLATNFAAPIGIYEYDPAGAQVGFWPVGSGNRGVAELGNGLLLWTDGNGIHTVDPVTSATADIQTGINARFVTRFAGSGTATTAFCLGDGTGAACPCANPGAAGNGCASATFPGGARLSASGIAGASPGTDTLVLTATNVPGPGLFFQSDGLATTPVPFGDGLFCATVGIIRLGVVFPTAGVASYPGGVAPIPTHMQGAVSNGDTKHYQCWYRSVPGLCNPNNFDLTQGLTLTWGP